MYEVGQVYTLTGEDHWTCLSFSREPVEHRPPNIAVVGPPYYAFINNDTGEWLEGTVEELPKFQQIAHEIECTDTHPAHATG